jgi:hypothetical protein
MIVVRRAASPAMRWEEVGERELVLLFPPPSAYPLKPSDSYRWACFAFTIASDAHLRNVNWNETTQNPSRLRPDPPRP